MRFEPLIIWWLILPLGLLGLMVIGWQIFKLKQQKKAVLLPWIRRACMVLLVTLLALGPSVPGGTSSPGVANLDVLFAVDTTASVGAEDYADGQLRLDGIKHDMLALGTKLKGAHFGIVTFDSKANVGLPFTSDTGTFTAAVQTLNREIFGTSRGSSIDKPIEAITQQLKNSNAAFPERSRLIFYMGDGEQTTESPVKSFKDVAKYVDGGAVLGYGTAKGAKILRHTGLENEDSKATYVNMLDPATKKFVPAISKLDETALKKIAEELGVVYQNRNKGGSVDDVYKSSNLELLIDKGKKVTHYLNLYWLFALPLGALLFWEWKRVLLLFIELRKDRRSRHA